jgi:purine-binding chemotaxis protein CheW
VATGPLQEALAAVPDRVPAAVAAVELEIFAFRLDQLVLGIDSTGVREVTRMGPLTPLPRSANFVLGVAGHRGEVLPVIDLLRFLALGEMRPQPRSRLFIGLSPPHLAGFLVDAALGLRKFKPTEVMAAPVGGQVSTEFLTGLVRIEGQTLSLLNLPRILHMARQRAVAR